MKCPPTVSLVPYWHDPYYVVKIQLQLRNCASIGLIGGRHATWSAWPRKYPITKIPFPPEAAKAIE